MRKPIILAWLGLAALLIANPLVARGAEDVIFYRPAEDGFIVDWLLSSQHRFPFAYMGATMNFDALTATGGEKDWRHSRE